MLVELGPPTALRAADLPSNLEAELTWNQAWTLSIEGQALCPSADYRLRRGSILLGPDGAVTSHPAPVTPPWAHMSVVRQARLRDQASVALARAADAGFEGAGTPPSAFHPGARSSPDSEAYMQCCAIPGPPSETMILRTCCGVAHHNVCVAGLQVCSVLFTLCLGVILGSYGSRSLATRSARLCLNCPSIVRRPLSPPSCWVCAFLDRSRSWPFAPRRSPLPPCGRFSTSRDSELSFFKWLPCYAAHWYVPTLFKCRQFQQHPWLRAPIVPSRMRRLRHGECGHGFPPCGQAASSVTACFHLISPSFSPSHLWASATVSLPALYWLLEEWTIVVLCMPAGIRLHMSGWPNEHSRSFGGDLPTVHESHTPPSTHTLSFGHFRVTSL